MQSCASILYLIFEAGQQLTDDLMQLYPEGSFDILYGANCAPGLGGLNSAEINGRTDFDVITVDNIEQFITACEKGVGATVLKGFVSQDPIDMGMTAMELAVAAAKGEDTGEYLHATAISLVTRCLRFRDSYVCSRIRRH